MDLSFTGQKTFWQKRENPGKKRNVSPFLQRFLKDVLGVQPLQR